jgi:hypothetical protein
MGRRRTVKGQTTIIKDLSGSIPPFSIEINSQCVEMKKTLGWYVKQHWQDYYVWLIAIIL